MAEHDRITLDLLLHRPAGVPPRRWTEVLLDACCRRLVPHLSTFSIGAEQGRMTISVPADEPGLLMPNLHAVAALYAELQPARAPAA
jgi:hypothetical protein